MLSSLQILQRLYCETEKVLLLSPPTCQQAEFLSATDSWQRLVVVLGVGFLCNFISVQYLTLCWLQHTEKFFGFVFTFLLIIIIIIMNNTLHNYIIQEKYFEGRLLLLQLPLIKYLIESSFTDSF